MFSLFEERHRRRRQTAYISILIMQRLLSGGLVIIAMHSALLFRNHYEAGIRSLTSFCLADLLVLTMGGSSEGRRGEQEREEGGRCEVASKTQRREGRRRKERDGEMMHSLATEF